MAQQESANIANLQTVGVEALASIVGCSVAHIYRLSSERRGLPPMIKLGRGRIRFRLTDIEKWLVANTIETSSESTKPTLKRGRGRPRKGLAQK